MKIRSLLLPILASSAFLMAGCGGSSGNSSTQNPTPATPANIAPSLSGDLALTSKAMEQASLSIELLDQDGDEVTVSVANIPDWMVMEQSVSQATFSISPGFFDIGEHAVAFTLTDGKDEVQYQLDVVIEDNPDAYVIAELTDEKVQGHWVLDNGTEWHLYAQEERCFFYNDDYCFGDGVYLDEDNKYHPVTWKLMEDNTVKIELRESYCLSCTVLAEYRLQVVYEYGERKRFRFESDTQEGFAANSTVVEHQTPSSFVAIPLGDASAASFPSFVNLDTSTFKIVGHGDYFWDSGIFDYFDEYPTISGHVELVGEALQFTNIPDSYAYATRLFYNKRSPYPPEKIAMNMHIQSVEMEYADSQLGILKLVLKPELGPNTGIWDTSRYHDLQEYLDSTFEHRVSFQFLSMDSGVQLETGKTYISSFYNPIDVNIGEYSTTRDKANTLIVDGDTSGRLVYTDAHTNSSPKEYSVQLIKEGEDLTMVSSTHTSNYQFYRTFSNELVLVYFDEDGEPSQVYPFFESQDVQVSIEDLQGIYRHASYRRLINNQHRFFTIDTSLEKFPYYQTSYGSGDRYVWKETGDYTLNLLGADCGSGSLTYDECLNSVITNASQGQTVLRAMKLKLHKIEGTRYYFSYDRTLYSEGLLSPTSIISSSIQVFEKVE